MPQTITAAAGDTLCGIAVRHGFKDCTLLRAEGANSAYLTRPLIAGDRVVVPDLREKEDNGATEQMHRFVRPGIPMPTIRFTHGTPNLPFDQDPTLAHLEISNFRTNRGGVNGTRPFPAGYGFHADGHADPDSFKVEVEDLGAGGSVAVELNALKPVYAPDGSISRHERFSGGEAAARRLQVTCNPVRGGRKVFRSVYLRLVADEEDQSTVPAQTLLVTDMADGANGDADKVEILDQMVEASVAVRTCPAADPNKCKAVAVVPVGQNKQRIKLCFHVFRTTPGGAVVGGLTEQMLRRRTAKWFRRAYAQASLAPKLVAPHIEFIDPPPANMLVICQDHGRTASGAATAGGASRLTFVLGDAANTGLRAILALGDPRVTVPLAAGMTPLAIGQAVVAALPTGFRGTAALNARAFNAANGSCDLIIEHTDGRRVMIRGESCNDSRATVAVARLDVNMVNSADNGQTLIPSTIDFRRVIRSVPGADDRLDCFVVGRFTAAGLRGRAFVPAAELGAGFQPPAPLRWAAVMGTTSSSGAVMDGGNNLPFTFPHEAGHVLNDAFHTDSADPNGPTELMSGTGTSVANGVDATKRICDEPYHVRYGAFNPVQTNPGDAIFVNISAVSRFRTRGAPVFEAW